MTAQQPQREHCLEAIRQLAHDTIVDIKTRVNFGDGEIVERFEQIEEWAQPRPHPPTPEATKEIKTACYKSKSCDADVCATVCATWKTQHDDQVARAATLAECERIYGLFHEVEMLHLNGMAYPDLYNEMVTRIKFIHTEPLSKDGRKKK
jgi:hypothetical protein